MNYNIKHKPHYKEEEEEEEETVFDWNKKIQNIPVKTSKKHFKSIPKIDFKISPDIDPKIEKIKLSEPSLGYAEKSLRCRNNYLKKHEGYQNIKNKNKIQLQTYCCKKDIKNSSCRKPAVPKHNELMKIPPKTKQKNYKKENIQMLKNQIKKTKSKQNLQYVDTRDGHRNSVISSGFIPQYTRYNPNYGKIPSYIMKFKKLIQKYHKQTENEENNKNLMNNDEKILTFIPGKPRIKHISQEERTKLLEVSIVKKKKKMFS